LKLKLKNTLITLFSLATKIKWFTETSELAIANRSVLENIKYDGYFKNSSFALSTSEFMQHLVIIYVNSFLDELDNEMNINKHPQYADQITKYMLIIKPALKQIRSWKDLKKIRNQLMVHNYKIKGKSVFESEDKIFYNVPKTNEDYLLLTQLVEVICQNIYPVFPLIVGEIDLDVNLSQKTEVLTSTINRAKEFERIFNEIEHLKNSLEKIK